MCGGEADTVGTGYFPSAEQVFASWQSVVGPQAASRSRLEPVSDACLAAGLLP
jgi:hypothetical protein